MAGFFLGPLPKGADLKPMVEEDDKEPEFGKKYPTIHEFKHVLATGNFQTWLTEISMEELEKSLLRMEIESKSFQSGTQSRLKDNEAVLKVSMEVVQGHERKLGYMKANATSFNTNTVKRQEYKTGCLRKHLELMQKEHDYDVKIQGIGGRMLQHQSHNLAMIFKMKVEKQTGGHTNPATMVDLANLFRAVEPAAKERTKLREEMHKVSEERAVVEKTLMGIFVPDGEDLV